ncbi:MAG: alpha/beta hydrolase [Intrasporangium sp.]|uniref:alpha/beta fold hydrolase n=1 Tax=Intrasporangium sp. TaxID=1925024 RepID=UPI00264A0571|nr:alpha/beta hydrolase [Intrasporangium sp.]MDN5794809.1 alpha/beta hydrolase [Intrasporangium sp.]
MTTVDIPVAALASRWKGKSRIVDLRGPVHWVDFGAPERDDRAPVVLVHGLGGSHLDWVRIAPALADHRHVVAVDLPGFGLTPAAGRHTTVRANARLLGRFVDEVLRQPAVLVGNSMGGMIALLLAADRPGLAAGLCLLDPSLPLDRRHQDPLVAAEFALFTVPFLSRAYLERNRRRLTAEEQVLRTLDLCFADDARIDPDVLEADVALAEYRAAIPGTDVEFLGAARSLLRVLARSRSYAAHIRSIDRPVLLVHGEQDRLVPFSAAEATAAANPRWETLFLPGVGHVPHLEVPGVVLDRLLPWLDRLRRASQ